MNVGVFQNKARRKKSSQVALQSKRNSLRRSECSREMHTKCIEPWPGPAACPVNFYQAYWGLFGHNCNSVTIATGDHTNTCMGSVGTFNQTAFVDAMLNGACQPTLRSNTSRLLRSWLDQHRLKKRHMMCWQRHNEIINKSRHTNSAISQHFN